MDRGQVPPLRSLPRVFLPGAAEGEPIELPEEEYQKLHRVLRLRAGDRVLVLPDDGTGLVCAYRGRALEPIERVAVATEPSVRLVLAQALPKADKLDEVVRMGSELGVAEFRLFPAERSVLKWDAARREDRLRRLRAVAREACEVSFRARLPAVRWRDSLATVLAESPEALALSEVEGVSRTLPRGADALTLVVGPEGGWAPREVALIGDRAVTLGPRVLRVDTAACAAVALALLD